MDPIKLFTVIALVSLPTVMFGGYSLLRLMKDRKLTPFQETYFRAGHAHAGVLLSSPWCRWSCWAEPTYRPESVGSSAYCC